MKTILLVDDELDTIEILEMLLGMEGFDVLKAYDGREGLEVAGAESPDLIVTDLMMPRLNGLEMAQRLKSQAVTCDIPIIMNSASKEPQVDGERPYAAFLRKPIDVKHLVHVIRSHLD